MATRMQQRRGTQAQWSSVDPILSAAEIGFESDTTRFKIGDGVNHWSNLEYFTTDSATAVTQQIQDAIDNLIAGAPGVLDTLNELAAAIGDDENFVTTVTSGLSSKAPIESPTFTGTVSGITKSMVGLSNVDNTSDANKPISTATQTALDAAATSLLNHESDTTNIHGIADTSLLATKTYADNAATTAVAAVIDAAPAALNTLNELAAALGDDANYATTVTNALAFKAPLESPTFTGTVILPTGTVTSGMILNGTIVNADINSSAGIDLSKLATDPLARANHTGTQESSTISDFTEAAQDAVGNSVGTGLTYTDSTGEIKVTPNTYDSYGSASAVAGDLSTHESDTTTHGVTGNIVGTSDTQTLTNKTLTSPKINEDVAVTATATELNTLDGITASTAELNILDGVTASASEINILDGATLSTTELNYVDGVTSAIQTQLNTLDTDKADLASPTFTGTVTVDNLEIGGALTFSGTATEISSTNTVIEDPLIYLADGNPGNINDLGFVANYNDGTYQHTGLVRDASDNAWKLFKGVTDEPTNTVNFGQGSLDDLKVAGLTASSITVGDVSNTEFGYLNGVTSAIQTQIDGKQAKIANVSDTEIGYLDGVTSAIQTQIDSKLSTSIASSTYAPIASPTFTGTVSGITSSMVGLGNVDNTSDANKPVSTATQTALDLKANLAGPTFTGTVVLPSTTSIGDVSATEIGYVDGVTSSIQTQLNAKAPISSPALTGIPTAPTASTGTDTTQVATTQFVNAAIANLVNLNLVLDGGGV